MCFRVSYRGPNATQYTNVTTAALFHKLVDLKPNSQYRWAGVADMGGQRAYGIACFPDRVWDNYRSGHSQCLFTTLVGDN